MQVFLSFPTVMRQMLLPFAYAESIEHKEDLLPLMADEMEIKNADYAPLLLGGMVDIIIFLVGFTNGLKSNQRKYLGIHNGEHFSVRDIIKIEKAFGLPNLRHIFRQHLYHEKKGYTFIISAEVYKELPYSSALIDLFESLATSKRIAFPIAQSVPLYVLPSNFQRRFEADFIASEQPPRFDYYPVTKEQWADLSQSLNAFYILKG
jgi:hypothetical protein